MPSSPLHRRSVRMQGYNYANDGAYFITICTQSKEPFLGEIIDGEMVLSDIGKIAEENWQNIEKFHEGIELLEMVIMPNHIHGIIVINRGNDDDSVGACQEGRFLDSVGACQEGRFSGSVGACQWHAPTNRTIRDISLPPKGVPSLINHFKGATKKWANANGYPNFAWQRNYYEHVIRHEKSYQKIAEYIVNNPKNWETDEYF